MAVGDDFKVSRRYRDDVGDLAARWRGPKSTWVSANRIDIVPFLMEQVLPRLAAQGVEIGLELVEDDVGSPDAWVDLGAGKLFVQNFIWDGAVAHEPHARLVLAHEIGHILLHRDQVHAFSKGLTKKLDFLDPEESAEQQANWFASSLLLPDEVLLRLSHLDDSSIATLAIVGEQVVRVRRRELEMDKRHRSYTGDQCPRCEGFAVMRVGITTVCDACGAKLASS